MTRESLKAVIQQFTERQLPRVLRRDTELPTASGKVINLIGARRTGKTFLMYQTMDDLLRAGIERRQIIYINFEDDRLYPVEPHELDDVLRAHSELFPDAARERRYLFFDELQNVEGWERYVRRLHDTEDVSLFLTGSSSALLQKDMSTAMRGRSITFEVFPLSFPEFLTFRMIDVVPYSPDSEARVIHAFHDYLTWGGFPEVVLAEEPLRMLILQEYASLMLHRDLIDRHRVGNAKLMHLLLKFCGEHTGCQISINKLYNDFSSRGIRAGKATLYDYMAMLEDAFIVFGCPKYDPSSRRQLQAPQKIHLLDPGLSRVYRPHPDRDIGHRFESIIYLHERRQRRDICYYRNGFELDMCWAEGAHFVNVAWDMTHADTQARELRAMDKGLAMWPAAEARLVYGSAPHLPPAASSMAVEGWQYLLTTP